MAKLSIRDLDLNNKYLFIRVDFNVPLSETACRSSTTPGSRKPCPPSSTLCAITPK